MRKKLSEKELEGLTESLFSQVSSHFKPDVIVHPGIRTDFLVTRVEGYFGLKPIIVDTARRLPLKKVMRLFFYEALDSLPDSAAGYVVDWYIRVVHSNEQKPKIVNEDVLEGVPPGSSVLVLDDVFCSGHTVKAVADALSRREVRNVKTAALIYTPINGGRPDFYALEGKYSLPWRNVGV